jgi:hypothetical protein
MVNSYDIETFIYNNKAIPYCVFLYFKNNFKNFYYKNNIILESIEFMFKTLLLLFFTTLSLAQSQVITGVVAEENRKPGASYRLTHGEKSRPLTSYFFLSASAPLR